MVNFANCNHDNPHQFDHTVANLRTLIGSLKAGASGMSKISRDCLILNA